MKQTSIMDYETRLLRVLDHIDTHLAETLDLEDLAAIACFSPFHFHRIFRGMTGEPLAGYIRRRRLERAAEKLLESDISITDLAFETGFESAEGFTRAYKARFGLSPSEYRRDCRRDNRQAGQLLMTGPALEAVLKDPVNSKARALSHFLERKGRKAMFDVKIKSIPAIRHAYLRHTGPYVEIGPVFEKTMALAGQQGLFGPQTQIMSLYHDDPHTVEASALRADVGLSISKDAEPQAPLLVHEIEAGDYGIALLKGPYEGLQAAYDWLYGQWLPQSGREASDRPCIEIYLTDPETTKPEDCLTEIRIPLA